MNVENILKVADAIENAALPIGFNMNNYHVLCAEEPELTDHTGNGCGTVGCIAGWAAFMQFGQNYMSMCDPFDCAAGYFDITEGLAFALFLPDVDAQWRDITAKQAVTVLRHLAETGVVDWTVAGVPAREQIST